MQYFAVVLYRFPFYSLVFRFDSIPTVPDAELAFLSLDFGCTPENKQVHCRRGDTGEIRHLIRR